MYSLASYPSSSPKKIFLFVLLIIASGSLHAQKPVLSLPIGHSGGVNTACFSKDGKFLVTGGNDNSIIVWDARSGYVIRQIATGAPVQQVSVTPDGLSALILTGINSGFANQKPQVSQWDLKTGNLVKKFNFTAAEGLQFLPKSGYLLVPDHSENTSGTTPDFMANARKMSAMSDEEEEAMEKLMEKRASEELKKRGLDPEGELTSKQIAEIQQIYAEIAMQARFGISGGFSSNISILDFSTQKPVGKLDFAPKGYQLMQHNGSEYILTASSKVVGMDAGSKEISAYEIKSIIGSTAKKTTPPVFKTFTATQYGTTISSSPAKGFFAVYSEEANSIELFQMDKTGSQGKIKFKGKEYWKAIFSADGNFIYVFSKAGQYKFIERWNTTTLLQDLSNTLPADQLSGDIALLSPQGDYYVAGTIMGLQKFSIDGYPLGRFTNRTFVPSAFEFSPDDKQVNIVYNAFSDLRELMVMAAEGEIKDIENAENRKMTKAEKEKLVETHLQEYSILTDGKTYKGFAVKWNIAEGSVLPAGNLQIKENPKKISSDKKYQLSGKKIRWGNIEANSFTDIFSGYEPEDAAEAAELKKAKEIYKKIMPGISDSASLPVMLLINRNTKDTASMILVDSTDWMIVLKNGYYMSSPNASKAVSYTRGMDVIGFDQLDLKNNRPDIVLKTIGLAEPVLIKAYRDAWRKRLEKNNLDSAQLTNEYSVPEAWIDQKDKITYEQNSGRLSISIIASDSKSKLISYNIWVNDVPVYGKKGMSTVDLNSTKLNKQAEIILSQGTNRIEVAVMNANGIESYKSPLFVNYTPAKNIKPAVYFIGIGIDRFSNSRYNLKYSAEDIRKLCRALKNKYSNIIIDTLINENVNIANIGKLKEKLLQTNVDDKLIISYSGHGMLSRDNKYFLSTYTVNFENPVEDGLPYEALEDLLDNIPARKKLLLIDACHSGEVDAVDLVRINKVGDSLGLKRGVEPLGYKKGKMGLKNSFELMQHLFTDVRKSTGAVVITAASGTQFAEEKDALENGTFTYCIIQTLNENKVIKISQLKNMVEEKVVKISGGQQRPTSRNNVVTYDWIL